MIENEFAALRAPLERDLAPLFDAFVQRHQLRRVIELGLYPRLRAEADQAGGRAWLEFNMGLDPAGRYFTNFVDDLPHEMAGGLCIDRAESEGLVRYRALVLEYEGRPYRSALGTFGADLERAWSKIRALDATDAFAGARRVIRRSCD